MASRLEIGGLRENLIMRDERVVVKISFTRSFDRLRDRRLLLQLSLDPFVGIGHPPL